MVEKTNIKNVCVYCFWFRFEWALVATKTTRFFFFFWKRQKGSPKNPFCCSEKPRLNPESRLQAGAVQMTRQRQIETYAKAVSDDGEEEEETGKSLGRRSKKGGWLKNKLKWQFGSYLAIFFLSRPVEHFGQWGKKVPPPSAQA